MNDAVLKIHSGHRVTIPGELHLGGTGSSKGTLMRTSVLLPQRRRRRRPHGDDSVHISRAPELWGALEYAAQDFTDGDSPTRVRLGRALGRTAPKVSPVCLRWGRRRAA